MNKSFISSFIVVLVMGLTQIGCKDDELDGLLNVDPAPASAITFPQSNGGANGLAIVEDNAFIIRQASLKEGRVALEIKVPEGQQIMALSIAAQRYRAPITAPNFSPAVPSDQALRTPRASVSRTTTPNLVTNLNVPPANTVVYSFPVEEVPAILTTSGTEPNITNLGAVKVGDTFRFFVRATLTDGSVHRAMEARVVVVE